MEKEKKTKRRGKKKGACVWPCQSYQEEGGKAEEEGEVVNRECCSSAFLSLSLCMCMCKAKYINIVCVREQIKSAAHSSPLTCPLRQPPVAHLLLFVSNHAKNHPHGKRVGAITHHSFNKKARVFLPLFSSSSISGPCPLTTRHVHLDVHTR